MSFVLVTIVIVIVLILLSFHVCDTAVRYAILACAAALLSYIIVMKLHKAGYLQDIMTPNPGCSCCANQTPSHQHQSPLPPSIPAYSYPPGFVSFNHDHTRCQYQHCEGQVPNPEYRRPQQPLRFENTLAHRGEGGIYDADWRFFQGDTIKGLYGLTGVSGDTHLVNRSIWGGSQAKRAMDIRARADKNNFAKWFTDDELGLSEKKVWWEHEVDPIA